LEVTKFNFNILTYFSQKYGKLQWRLWGKLNNYLNGHNSAWLCIKLSRNFWFCGMVFGVGQFNGVIYIYPWLTPVAMATNFGTKLTITRPP